MRRFEGVSGEVEEKALAALKVLEGGLFDASATEALLGKYRRRLLAIKRGPSATSKKFDGERRSSAMDAFIGSGLNWLGEDLAGSIVLEKTANEIIEKLDNDTRFSRHEELKEGFDDYLPEWAADPHELVGLFTDMDM